MAGDALGGIATVQTLQIIIGIQRGEAATFGIAIVTEQGVAIRVQGVGACGEGFSISWCNGAVLLGARATEYALLRTGQRGDHIAILSCAQPETLLALQRGHIAHIVLTEATLLGHLTRLVQLNETLFLLPIGGNGATGFRLWIGAIGGAGAHIAAAMCADLHRVALGRAAGSAVCQCALCTCLPIIQIQVVQASAHQFQRSTSIAGAWIQCRDAVSMALACLGDQFVVVVAILIARRIAGYAFDQLGIAGQIVAAMRATLVALLGAARALQDVTAATLNHRAIAGEDRNAALGIVALAFP